MHARTPCTISPAQLYTLALNHLINQLCKKLLIMHARLRCSSELHKPVAALCTLYIGAVRAVHITAIVSDYLRLLVFLTEKPADCRNRANQNPSCQWFYIPMRMPLQRANTVKPMPILLQRKSAAVGTDPSCIAQVFLFAIVDSLPRRCNALLNRLLSARMILSTQMENSLPTVAISNYCMRGCYMIYEISMHA